MCFEFYVPTKLLTPIKNCSEKMDIQKLLLSKYIENWSRDFAQVDDICVFGIRSKTISSFCDKFFNLNSYLACQPEEINFH